MGNDDEALWGRNAIVVVPLEPAVPEQQPPPPPPRSRRRTVLTTVGVVVGVAVAVALLGRSSRTPTPAEVEVPVRHERFTVGIDAVLTCDPGRAVPSSGVQSMVIDTWTDISGHRVRNIITYSDGSTYDFVATGNFSRPDSAVERGERKDVAVGCLGDDGTPIAIVTPPDLPFALDFTSQVTPEQRSAFAHFHQQARRGGTTRDDQQRTVTMWTAKAQGTWAVQHGVSLVGRQTWQWSVSADEPSTVTEQWFMNSVEGLGSAARGESLDLSEETTVAAAFFDTSGHHRVIP